MSVNQDSAWQTLLDAGLVSGAEPPAGELESPWYVRLMLGVAGWIAALFLLGFVAAGLAWIIRSEQASLFSGLSMLGLAWWLLRKFSKQDFMSQFALAVSFAGQVLFAVGVFGWFGVELQSTTSWIIMTLAQAMLALLMPNTIHRLWSAMAASISFYMLLHSVQLAAVAPAIILASAAWAWLHEFSLPRHGSMIRPMAYGLLLALVLMDVAGGALQPLAGMNVVLQAQPLLAPWMGDLLTGAVLLWVVWTLLQRGEGGSSRPPAIAILATVMLLVLVTFKAPGLPVGVCIIVLGYAHGNRVLTGLGIAALLIYASTYYYTLDATLLVKSEVLAASGLVLLLARWLMRRVLSGAREADHA
jgi:hypothetical protein